MALRFRVVSEHAIHMGEQSTKVFGVHGGCIGRGTDNEWILPDPERYLSGKHARVDFRAGTYVLVDNSSNGTYVNGARRPCASTTTTCSKTAITSAGANMSCWSASTRAMISRPMTAPSWRTTDSRLPRRSRNPP